MLAADVFNQNDGDTTKAYYASMNRKGYHGLLAVALFRAQKRSEAAKRYRKGRGFITKAYDVKNWSLGQVCAVLQSHDFGFRWGWKIDRKRGTGHPWVLYVDLPTGQCSFHTAERLAGPDYTLPWVPGAGSRNAILSYCDSVWEPNVNPSSDERARAREEAARACAVQQQLEL